jgi:ADP-heptose:LPS heptosyltransferase
LVVDRIGITRLLIIKLRAVGDVLLSTIVTGNLRRAFPGAHIDFLTEPPGADILKGNPYLDQVIVYDRATMTGPGLIRRVRSNRYDLVLDLFGNPRTALITRLSGARLRVGYRFRGRSYAYNHIVEPRGDKVHNTQFNLDALEAIDVPVVDRSLHFYYSHDDESYIDDYLARAGLKNRFRVGLITGGGWYTKRWGLQNYAALADRLVDRYQAAIILPWGPGQFSDTEHIQSMMRREAFVPPATTLQQLGVLLKRCAVVVSNDSGPMHIAAAVGTPVLGIYGPTDPRLQGPYGPHHLVVRNEEVPCLGCNLTKCPIGHPCMLELSVERVEEAVGNLLAQIGEASTRE